MNGGEVYQPLGPGRGVERMAGTGADADARSNRSGQVGTLLAAALAHPEAQRARLLADACHGDDALRQEVESLLAAHEDAGEFLATPAPRAAARSVSAEATPRIPSGTRLGPYEVVAPLGAGGMGEVYHARDTRLDRSVALKVLNAQLANEARDRDRFEREARAVSRLAHPHICPLYDVGSASLEGGEVPFLVMELLQGETLAARLRRGPLAVAEALTIAIQTAEALAAAHAEGIVHRDLKPANIMLTPPGAGRSSAWHVRLLDFGLARLRAETGRSKGSEERLATLTREGLLIGTLPYMAPEQVRGEPVDARADLFAFGAVLYEMLTGRRAFTGKSPADLAAAILERDPAPLSTVQPAVPETLERFIRTSLAKDPATRWQHAQDMVLQLKAIEALDINRAGRAGHARPRERAALLAPAMGFLLAAALMVAAVRFATVAPPSTPVRQLDLSVPRLAALESLTLSPDGEHLAFIAPQSDGMHGVWVRSLSEPLPRQLLGTAGAHPESPPFWSPDGEWIAFVSGGKLRRVPAAGGEPHAIADVTGAIRGGDWGRDGNLLLGTGGVGTHGVHRVDATGGALVPVVPLEPHAFVHALPKFLPDGRRFLYLIWASNEQHRDICVASLDQPTGQCLGIHPDLFAGVTGDGHILYIRGGTLFAQPFDVRTTRLTGARQVVVDRVAQDEFGRAAVSVANAGGTLVYQPERAEVHELVWVDRRGTRLGTVGEPAVQHRLAISADGRTVAVERPSRQGTAIWKIEVPRGAATTAAPANTPHATAPLLSQDGLTLSYRTRLDAGHSAIVERPIRGGPERVLFEHRGEGVLYFADRSADGTQLVVGIADRRGRFVNVVPVSGGAPVPVVGGSGIGLGNARISSDGRWLAYESRQTGRSDIYVSAIPATGEQRQVSVSGGQHPCWAADGRELFFVAPDGWLMSAPVTGPEPLEFGMPERLFKTELAGRDLGSRRFAVTADGRRFLLGQASQGETPVDTTMLRVILNWSGMLSQ